MPPKTNGPQCRIMERRWFGKLLDIVHAPHRRRRYPPANHVSLTMPRGADRSLSFVFLRRNSFFLKCRFHRKGMLRLDQWGNPCWLLTWSPPLSQPARLVAYRIYEAEPQAKDRLVGTSTERPCSVTAFVSSTLASATIRSLSADASVSAMRCR
jgi:hypothetical protein